MRRLNQWKLKRINRRIARLSGELDFIRSQLNHPRLTNASSGVVRAGIEKSGALSEAKQRKAEMEKES